MNEIVLLMALILSTESETGKPSEPLDNSVSNHSTEIPIYLTPDTVNVNTVIFKESDLRKTCWNAEDIVLLATRQEMQELIPKKVPGNITTLLEYYKLSLETINLVQTDEGSKKKLLLSAFADAVGGYLKLVGIPQTNEAYYAGEIDHAAAKQMHDLFDAVKQFLQTTGEGWFPPQQPTLVLSKVQPINLSLADGEDACEEFVTTQTATSGTADLLPIPMPYIDDEENPNSIALPFRFRSLFSLGNGNTTNMLLRYYELGLSCLATSYPQEDVEFFNRRVKSWIFESVVPHLQETKWYPGFWGVKKIIETMKRLESEEIQLPTTRRLFITDITDRPQIQSPKPTTPKLPTVITVTPEKNQTAFLWLFNVPQDGHLWKLRKLTSRALIVIAVCCAMALLFPYFFYLVFCRRRCGPQQSLPRESEMELLNTLVALYWELRESNEKKDSCSLDDGFNKEPVHPKLEKFRNFWRKKKTAPMRTVKKPDLNRERSVHFDNLSIESLPAGCSERVKYYQDNIYRSE